MRTPRGVNPVLVAFGLALGAAQAQDLSAFKHGPRITDFGPAAIVEGVTDLPADTTMKVVFDVSEGSRPDRLNRRIETVARYLNMHAQAGLPDDQVRAALVLHGPAARDATQAGAHGGDNPNAALIAALIAEGVPVVVCGQSAAASGLTAEEFLPGVEMALSAITANARFQQQGYTQNPF